MSSPPTTRSPSPSSSAASSSTSSSSVDDTSPLLRYSRLRTPTLPRLDDENPSHPPTLDVNKTGQLLTTLCTPTSILLFTTTHLHICSFTGVTLSPPILLPKNYTPSPSLTTSQTILLPSGSSLYTYTLMSSSNPIKIDYGSVISCMCSTGLGTFLGFESTAFIE